jgi:hypothetical protein
MLLLSPKNPHLFFCVGTKSIGLLLFLIRKKSNGFLIGKNKNLFKNLEIL